ncbi:hypothetical protein [Nonomuraea sp. NPDC001831]|uniref:hypothetical protein n=1 Tax=Nonomuraea sp. NPDC001831 TaxID=3364340 RepID=UPI0036AD6CD6
MSEQRTTYELVEAVVARLRPDEVELVPDLWAAYVNHPDPERAGERLLGSGVLADVAGWAPVVVSFVGGAVLEALKEEITERTRGVFGWRARRKARRQALTEPLALNGEQRRRICAAVLSRARALGMSPERAQLLSDAVAGELQRESEPQEP